jgi:hypothetical protein
MRSRRGVLALVFALVLILGSVASAGAGNGHGNGPGNGHGKGAAKSHGKGTGNGGGNSQAAHACNHGGYRSLVGADGTTFRNTGACVSFAAHGGKFATGIIIPAGKTATLSNAMFGDFTTNCPGDQLAYGYQLNLGANVQVATGGAGCQHVAGAVVGPFPTATLLRIWLTDFTPPGPYTFYSDSATHALVTGSNPFVVSIMDSFFGQRGPSATYLPSGPGHGNLNVTVTTT